MVAMKSILKGLLLMTGIALLSACGRSLDAQERDAAKMYDIGNFKGAYAQWTTIADESAHAAEMLGYMHEHALGVPRDETVAISWYTKAVELGSGKAALALYFVHMRHGNDENAMRFLERAVGLGNEDAAFTLARMVWEQAGDEQRYKALISPLIEKKHLVAMAYDEIKSANERQEGPNSTTAQLLARALTGESAAQADLGELLMGDRQKRYVMFAAHFIQASAAAGNPRGEFNLGVMHLSGRGVVTNCRTALDLFEKAAAKANEKAKQTLSSLRASGYSCAGRVY